MQTTLRVNQGFLLDRFNTKRTKHSAPWLNQKLLEFISAHCRAQAAQSGSQLRGDP